MHLCSVEWVPLCHKIINLSDFEEKWLHLEIIMLNKTHKLECHVVSLIWDTQNINQQQTKWQIIRRREIDFLQKGKGLKVGGKEEGSNKKKLKKRKKKSYVRGPTPMRNVILMFCKHVLIKIKINKIIRLPDGSETIVNFICFGPSYFSLQHLGHFSLGSFREPKQKWNVAFSTMFLVLSEMPTGLLKCWARPSRSAIVASLGPNTP